MKKKIKLKKQVYYILGFIIITIIAGIYGKEKYDEYQYQKTYEYKLTTHGYTLDEFKILEKNFSDLDYFLNNPVNKNYPLLISEKYYLKKNFTNYVDYMNNNKKLDLTTIVRNINIHIDKPFYEYQLNADINKDTTMLVNKYYLLPSDYEPTDLVNVSQNYSWGTPGSQRVRKIAYDAFIDMWNAAKTDGYYLMINSSYRSYQDQETVYNNYKKNQGTKYADSIAARPGSSEHQTGLCMDIFSKQNTNKASFKDSEEANWLKENSYKYGFILRYPEDKVNLTGYNYESWHYRYVGTDIATAMHNENLTFEEYYAYYLES